MQLSFGESCWWEAVWGEVYFPATLASPSTLAMFWLDGLYGSGCVPLVIWVWCAVLARPFPPSPGALVPDQHTLAIKPGLAGSRSARARWSASLHLFADAWASARARIIALLALNASRYCCEVKISGRKLTWCAAG